MVEPMNEKSIKYIKQAWQEEARNAQTSHFYRQSGDEYSEFIRK